METRSKGIIFGNKEYYYRESLLFCVVCSNERLHRMSYIKTSTCNDDDDDDYDDMMFNVKRIKVCLTCKCEWQDMYNADLCNE